MAFDSKPAKTPVLPSEKGTSDPQDAQLFPSGRVDSDVSSIAIDRGVLAMGGGPRQPQLAVEAGVSGELTDAQVMLKVKAGDDSAFDYLVQKYRRPMMSFMYRMAHNAAVAEDLAQEVFLRVYRARENYEASAKFTTWLYRIATNLAVIMHKYQQMDYRQIADVLKLSESATKSLLFRAYETLREQLKEFI